MSTATLEPKPQAACDNIDPVALYDIFYETGTVLGGTYVALKRKAVAEGNAKMAEYWQRQHIALVKERRRVRASDLDMQK